MFWTTSRFILKQLDNELELEFELIHSQFLRMIVDSGCALINYHAIEILSS